MMKNKACGKIILLGEHAVVYDKPGIAVPIRNKHISVNIIPNDTFSYSADRGLYKQEKERLEELLDLIFLSLKVKKANLHIQINSTIPASSGLGSSAALSISTIKSVSRYFDLALSKEKINELAYECEKLFHGRPSGIDNNVVVYEQPVYFHRGKTEFIKIKEPLQLVIADSGIKTSTKEIVLDLKNRYEKNKKSYDRIFDEIEELVNEAKTMIEHGYIKGLGFMMTKNHYLLKQLGVSCGELDDLVEIALKTGSFGAKLAGKGKGGNIIALVDEKTKDKVMKKLRKKSKDVIYTVVS